MTNRKVNPRNFPTLDNVMSEFLKDPELKQEYDALEPQYQIISKIIEARNKTGLTQKEIARRMGTTQSVIARFESGNCNPTLNFVQRLAKALNTTISLSFS